MNKIKLKWPESSLLARTFLFVCSFFGGAYLIRHIGESNLYTFTDYKRGNRRRINTICVLTWQMAHLTALVYVHLFSALQPSTHTKEAGRQNKRLADQRLKTQCQMVFAFFTLCVHSCYFLYIVDYRIPWPIYALCTISLGVWIHLTFFSVGFFLLSMLIRMLKLCKIGRTVVDYSFNYGKIKNMLTNCRVQVTITLVASALLCIVQFVASDKLIVKEATYTMKQWPHRTTLRFAMISDLHAGAVVYRREINKVVEAVNELNVDALLVVGDVVDAPRSLIEERVSPLRNFRSKYGTFMVSGNHEYYYGNYQNWVSLFKEYGINVMQNSIANIQGVCLVGLADISSNKSGIIGEEMRPNVIGKCPEYAPIIVLEHNPAAAPKIVRTARASGKHVDLILSGHTHAGQYYVVAPVVYWFLPFFYGQYTVDTTQLLVSAGTLWQAASMKIWGASQIWLITVS